MPEPRLTVQSDRTQLKDSSGVEIGTKDNRLEVEASNTDIYNIINDLLREQKKTNMYLSIANDLIIEDTEIIM